MEVVFRRLSLTTFLALIVSFIAGCGGGSGGDSSDSNNFSSGSSGWEPGVFQPASDFANQCSSPLPQNNFLRSWSDNTYLWYDEIEDRDPANYSDPIKYFDLLRTDEFTPSGSRKDNFHFTMPTEEYDQQSQQGVVMGYGLNWAIVESVPPRKILVAYTDSGEPVEGEKVCCPEGTGETVAVNRGAEVLNVDGVDVEWGADTDTLNRAFFPTQEGETHTFRVRHRSNGLVQTVSLVAGKVTVQPVQHVKVLQSPRGERVGYMLFNDHNAPAEKALKEAVEQLSEDGIDELVLDLRYNGGGRLAIASQLAYMIAGDERTGAEWAGSEWAGSSRVFEDLKFNKKHPDRDPITNEPLTPVPFIPVTIGLSSLAKNQRLPALDLERVFVLAGPGTCSASESIINGLRGVDVKVVLIGEQTCGKPYGFYPQGNCGTTYFTIQFKGVNDKGFGEYSDGFVPSSSDDGWALVRGCEVSDDFSHALGDPGELRLAAALDYVDSGSCAAFASSYAGLRARVARADDELRISAPEWRQNRIVLLPRKDGQEVK